MFEESYSMRLTDDDGSLKSYLGSACSLFLLVLTLIYAYFKFEVLLQKSDANILSTVNDLHFTDDFVFDYSNGFRTAIAFTAYDNERDVILDPTYGELIFNAVSWGERDGKNFFERKKLDNHPCTREELSLEGDEGWSE